MSEQMIVGRKREREILRGILESARAEFLAIYGRRRVGKTFLISEFFRDKGLYFELTGIKGASKALQIKNFAREYTDCFHQDLTGSLPKDWVDAFTLLRHQLEQSAAERIILFFDELPWLASPRSGFLQALDHLWNRYLSRDARVILIVCGSAASWMNRKVIHDRGGLYGRLTQQIRLLPFSLLEAEEYFVSKSIVLARKQIAELYMATGGIPKYLSLVPRGKSVPHIIQELFFDPRGLLATEFRHLYASLFDGAGKHTTVVRLLARYRSGLTKNAIIDALSELSSGGGLSDLLAELEESGFISYVPQFGKKKKDGRYLLTDEYSLFYLTWIEPLMGPGTRTVNSQYWVRQHDSPAYRAWAGYAFESLCLKHIDHIVKALELSAVAMSYAGWRYVPQKGVDRAGTQIDLVIARADRCINLCEAKFSDSAYTIDKEYAAKLQTKKITFREVSKTKSTLFTTLIAANGVVQNQHFFHTVDSLVTLDDFFV